MSAETGVIHDIGYQRYTGPRLGRRQIRWSLFTYSLRAAYGLGRGAKSKIFPWSIGGIIMLVALILTAIRTQDGPEAMTYWEFPQAMSVLVILFCAGVAPELVSRDLRGGVLPLYFSRPLTRADYAVVKLAATVSAVWLVLAGPLTLMFLGGAFAVKRPGQIPTELLHYGQGLVSAALYALAFGALSLLVASLAGRRTVAAAMIVAVFLVTTPVYGVLMAVSGGATTTAAQLSGLVSPMTMAAGAVDWLFGDAEAWVGPYGSLYAYAVLGLAAISAILVLVRYRKAGA
jgi:ABC-2 type transport system permease protein